MNQLAGFAILLVAALLLIVSSVTNVKVIAQGNDSSSEKSTTAAKTCSPELFKEKPGLCAVLHALAHNKESSASAEKPAEAGTIISAPIEVKKGPTMEENNATAPLTGEKLEIKKPASSNPVSENCLKTTTKSGESLCLTAPTIPKVADLAYEAGVKRAIQELAAKPGRNVFTTRDIQEACAVVGFAGDEHCKAGFKDTLRNIVLEQPRPEVKPEGPVVCKGPAGTANGLSTTQPETGCRR
jgi:hypothetical protein